MCDEGRRKHGTQFLPSFLPSSFLQCQQAHSVVCDSKKKSLKRWQKLRCGRWDKIILFMMGEIVKMREIDFSFWHCQLAPECVKERARESESKDERGRGKASK